MSLAMTARSAPTAYSVEQRVAKRDWNTISNALNDYGCARLESLMTPQECAEIAALYSQEARFRSHIHMARHGFGKGEYRYFKYPLPDPIAALRTALYPPLCAVANAWNERMAIARRYPECHTDFFAGMSRERSGPADAAAFAIRCGRL